MQVNFITARPPVSDMNMHLYSEVKQSVGEVSDFCSFHMLESFFNGVHMKHDEVLPSPVAYKEYFSINILTLQHVAVNK